MYIFEFNFFLVNYPLLRAVLRKVRQDAPAGGFQRQLRGPP
jgi:hypothetical protein